MRFDIAVIGSGFAGSILAMVARRLGLSVVLLERGSHPRVVIGESSTPLSNLLLEELADRYDLPQLRQLSKWGSWQETLPGLACGLKRGFTFIHHQPTDAPDARPMRERQLLVAASPNNTIADTHWYRADVDAWLVEEARALGVEYIDQVELATPLHAPGGWSVCATRESGAFTLHARLLFDATGPRGFLHRAFALAEVPLPDYPATSALYGHFTGVKELAEVAPSCFAQAPYPVDAAALHHVFAGGWMWVLRFNNRVTSAGVAVTNDVGRRLNLAAGSPAWHRLLASFPEAEQQFSQARAVRPLFYLPTLAFRSSRVAGPGWALLPSASGFVDPLLSTGFTLSLLGISRLAKLLVGRWDTPGFADEMEAYARHTDEELLATARLIGALYRCMDDVATFRAVSLLYFAAASYSEAARRLGTPSLAGGFLLHDHAVFGPASRRILGDIKNLHTAEDRDRVSGQIYNLIEHFDVAGLSARPADHSYPVRAADLFASAHKLGANRQQITDMLERSGFPGSFAPPR